MKKEAIDSDGLLAAPFGAGRAGSTAALTEVWRLAWPTVLTMTSYPIMQFVDKLMVGQVGPLEVAAQGNGGIWAFVPLSVAMGALTVVNSFVSQNLGAGTPRNGPKYAWAALWLSGGIWLLLLAWAALLPFIFRAMGHADLEDGERLLAMETGYAQILLAGSIVTLGSRSLHHYFFGLHRPAIVFLSSIAGNLVNMLCAYVFIFGAEGLPRLGLPGVPGMPALGVYGAAVGTVLGTAVEFLVPLAVFLGRKMHAELGSRSAWRFDPAALRDLLRIGWPSGLQFGNEIACWALFMSWLVAKFGPDHLTAGWIVLGYLHLSFMPAVGFSVAVTSLVGRYVGAGRPDEAVRRARVGVAIAVCYTTTCGLMFFLFRHQLVGLFVAGDVPAEQAAEIIRIGGLMMICAAVFQTMDAFGIVYTGALRGAGDTVWPGVATMVLSWTLIIGGGLVMVTYWPQLQSLGPWMGAAAYIIIYGMTMGLRFESGRWRSIKLVHGLREAAARIAPLGPAPPPAGPEGSLRDEAEEIGMQRPLGRSVSPRAD